MTVGKKIFGVLVGLGVAFLQFIMTQVATFVVSLLIPGMGDFPQTHPVLFVVILGVTFPIGVFLTGWLALKFHWLKSKPVLPARLVGTLLGAYLPLVIALFVYPTLEPGNPFFFVSMLTSILGFHIPGWFARK